MLRNESPPQNLCTDEPTNIYPDLTEMMVSDVGFQVFGLGQCSLDYIGKVDFYPPPDVKCEMRETLVQGGGPVATALTALCRWGISCCVAGVVGDDLFGGMIEQSLRDEGVDTAGLVVRQGGTSQFAVIAAEPDLGRRTIFWRRPGGPPLRPEEIDPVILRRAKLFHTDGLCMEAALFAAREARRAGVTVVVDGGTLREGMLDLARLSDCFVVSEVFAHALTGGDNPRRACQMLSELGPRLVGVTLGKAGYIAMAGGEIIERAAYPVDAADTTGCGDVFHAGLSYGLLQGWDARKCLDLGAWAAAQVGLQLGGRTGIPTLAALQERYPG
jgi:sulfofructose kinase